MIDGENRHNQPAPVGCSGKFGGRPRLARCADPDLRLALCQPASALTDSGTSTWMKGNHTPLVETPNALMFPCGWHLKCGGPRCLGSTVNARPTGMPEDGRSLT